MYIYIYVHVYVYVFCHKCYVFHVEPHVCSRIPSAPWKNKLQKERKLKAKPEIKTQWEDSFSLEDAAVPLGQRTWSPLSLWLREWLGVTLGCRFIGYIFLKLDAKSWTLCIWEEICSKKEHLNNVGCNIKKIGRKVLVWDLWIMNMNWGQNGIAGEKKIQYIKFIKVNCIETETVWAPVNTANLHPSTWGPVELARWNLPTKKKIQMKGKSH